MQKIFGTHSPIDFSTVFIFHTNMCEIINVHPVRNVKKQTQIKVPKLNYIFCFFYHVRNRKLSFERKILES